MEYCDTSSQETVTLDLVKDHDLVDLEYEFIPDTLGENNDARLA